MTNLIGAPRVPTDPAQRPSITGTVRYTRSYAGGGVAGLGTGEYPIRYDWPASGDLLAGTWLLDTGAASLSPVPLAAARFGQSDPAPEGVLIIAGTLRYPSGAAQAFEVRRLPVETSEGVLDLRVEIDPPAWTTPQQLADLIGNAQAATAQAQAAAQSVADATLDLSAERAAVHDALADIAGNLIENTVYASDTADDPPLPNPYRAGVRGRKLTASGNVLYLVTAPAETPGWLPTQELLSGDAVAAVEAATADARVAAGEATAAIGGLSGYRLVDALDGLTDRRGRRVVAGYADELGQSPQHITEDGRTWMHGAAVGDMDVQQGEPGSGIAWALTDRDERMAAWVTDAGEFGAASLTAALRSGRYTVCVCDGDSMTQGLGSSRFAFTANSVAYPGGGYPYALQQHLGGAVQVVNRGCSSAQAYDIAARTYGGGGVAAQYGVGAPVGGTYPLTGLNNRSPLLTPNGGTLSQRGRLGEVRGTLMRDNSPADWQANRGAYYTFTPDPGEPTLETSATPATPRRIYTWHPNPAYTDQPHIIWAGRNNVGDHAQTVESVRAMLSALAPDVPRLVIGVLASQTETWGNGREVVEEINRQLAELAGPAFFDPNEVLGRNADGTLRLDGTPNPAWMSDTLHCNDAGYQRLADALYARIVREGWYD